MDHPLERYALQPARLPQEWSAYHAIRQDAIFSALLPGQAYDEHDPDEFQHRHLPHVLVRDGEIIGTLRIDLVGETQAGLRLIAIRRDLQRQGHGSVLLRLAEHAARFRPQRRASGTMRAGADRRAASASALASDRPITAIGDMAMHPRLCTPTRRQLAMLTPRRW